MLDRASERKVCACRLCVESRMLDAIVESGDPVWLTATVHDLWERLGLTEADNEVMNCILKGEWASSIGHALRILEVMAEKIPGEEGLYDVPEDLHERLTAVRDSLTAREVVG